jgi:hypothetical protein
MFETFFTLTNIEQVMLDVNADTHVVLQVKCPHFCLILTPIGMYQQILVKLSSTKFHENSFNG